MRCIYEQIISNLETLIPAIRAGEGVDSGVTSDGYNFDWPAAINLHDQNLIKRGPFADFWLLGVNPGNADGNMGGMDWSLVSIRIELGYRYDAPPSNPIRQAEIDAMKCYDDIKRLFGQNTSAAANGNDGAFSISIYQDAVFEYASNDALAPARLHTFWRFSYLADRRHPDVRIHS